MKSIMRSILLVLSLAFSTTIIASPAEKTDDAAKAKKEPTLSSKIADLNLQTFPNEESEHINTNSYVEWLSWMFKRRTEPKPKERRENAFKLIEEFERSTSKLPITDDIAMWSDLTLFVGQRDKQRFVANSIDRTQTELGKISLYRLLAEPLDSQTRLAKRQLVIKTLVANPAITASLKKALNTMATAEPITLGFWQEHDDFQHESKRATFDITALDEEEACLQLKHLYNRGLHSWFFITDVMATATLLGYGVSQLIGYQSNYLDQNLGRSAGMAFGPILDAIRNHRFQSAILALFIGGMGVFYLKNHFDWVHGNFLFDHYLQTIMIHVATYMRDLNTLHSIIKANPELATFDEFQPLQALFEKRAQMSAKVDELIQSLNSETFTGEASFFSFKGRVLRAFLLASEIKAELQEAIAAAGKIDAYTSTATLINEYADKDVTFCFPTYVAAASTPSINITNFWHPILPTDKVVTNNITFGIDGQTPNLIITGPNEGGKSTILKAITLCLLFAQTLGIAPAQAMTFTPFHSIATYLNLTDDIGAGNSLFKAEVLRAQQLIERIEKAPCNEFYFAAFDEMFNGTTPVEASAASYSVAKHLASFPNSICLFATHFSIMTTLENVSDRVSNYHVQVDLRADGTIGYPYKLTKGISSQHVAIPILRNQGFAKTVLDDAQTIATRIAPSFDTNSKQ
jgi:DNA mismatch repair protein MutS